MESWPSWHQYVLSGYMQRDYSSNAILNHNSPTKVEGREQQLDARWKLLCSGDEFQKITTGQSLWVRVNHLGLALISIPIDLFDVVGAAITGVFTVLSAVISGVSGGRLSKNPWNAGFFMTIKRLDSIGRFLPTIYEHLLKTVDPSAEVKIDKSCIATSPWQKKLREWAKICLENDNSILYRQVISRLCYVAFAVVSLGTRIIGGICGVLFAVGTLGASPFTAYGVLDRKHVKWLNSQAYTGLYAPVIISELFYSFIKVINPFAGTRRESGNILFFLASEADLLD